MVTIGRAIAGISTGCFWRQNISSRKLTNYLV
jgi:hypothetical protein